MTLLKKLSSASKLTSAPPLVKRTAIEDLSTGTWYERFEFRDHLGKRKSLAVLADIGSDSRKLLSALQRAGARLPRDAKQRKRLIDAVIASQAPNIVRHAARPGWQKTSGARLRYSYGDKMFGEAVDGEPLAPPLDEERRGPSGVTVSGSLHEWQERVGKVVKRSPCAMLMVTAAFAASLLRFAEMNSFGIHAYGEAKRGKSTALTAGGSVIGLGREESLSNWNTTNASVLELAVAPSSDSFFPINESGAIKGKRSDAYQQLRELTFAFAEGRERGRHSSFLGQPSLRDEPARGIFASSGEHSLSEYAAMAGQVRDDGESFRLVDFPAIVSKTDSIFETLPEGVSGLEATDQLRTAGRECSGTAFPPYLSYLMPFGEEGLKRQVTAAVEEFLAYVRVEATDGVSRYLARTFGILYAGGLMASKADVWRWERSELLYKMRYCFRIAKQVMKPIDPLPEALGLLRSRLQGAEVGNGATSASGLRTQLTGYWEQHGPTRVYTVNASAFKSWLGGKERARLVLQDLLSRNLLVRTPGAGGSGAQLSDKDLGGQTLRWPNGKVCRSFRFSDPFAGQTSPTLASASAVINGALPSGGLSGFACQRDHNGKILYWEAVTVTRIEEDRAWFTWDHPSWPEPDAFDLDSVAILVRSLKQ